MKKLGKLRLVIIGTLAVVLVVVLGNRYLKPVLARYTGNVWQSVLGVRTRYRSSYRRKATPTPKKESLASDKIKSIKRFADLPYGIKKDLDRKYSQSIIKTGIHWQLSTVSRQAVRSIMMANFVNKVSGGVLAAIDGGKQKVAAWMAEELAKAVGSSVISWASSGTTADVTVTLYDGYQLNKKLAGKTFKAISKSSQLSAEIAAWVLEAEMAYINKNVSQGYQKLANIDLWRKDGPLEVYIIGIDGESKDGKKYHKGVAFYYYNSRTRKYVNYYNDVVSTKIDRVQKKTKKSSSSSSRSRWWWR